MKFTKEDIRDGDIVLLDNGDKLIYCGELNRFEDLSKYSDNDLYNLDSIGENFSVHDFTGKITGFIVQILRATHYETLYEQEYEEMTIDEISHQLGKRIKIVEK